MDLLPTSHSLTNSLGGKETTIELLSRQPTANHEEGEGCGLLGALQAGSWEKDEFRKCVKEMQKMDWDIWNPTPQGIMQSPS